MTDRQRLARAVSEIAERICEQAYVQVRSAPHEVEQYPGGPMVIVLVSGRHGGASGCSIVGGDMSDLASSLVSALKQTGLVDVVDELDEGELEGSA